MAQNIGLAGAAPGAGALGQAAQGAQAGEHTGKRLGAFLCWAVVFADIGTSVYYTPGILFTQYHQLAGFFVILTLVAFGLLTLKYAEVSVRFPEGGGVVTVAARAINPWAGAVGGMFILVDYFLTSAVSSLSGLQYFQNVVPAIGPIVLPATIVVVTALGILNWWGIKESAVVSATIAVAAFVSDIIILALVFWYVPFGEIIQVFRDMFSGPRLTGLTLVTGFAGAFLAFSGLESISQLSPVMRIPRRKTVTIALALVVITVGITSPLLTVFSTVLLNPAHSHFLRHPIVNPDPNQFISLLGGAFGGLTLEIATAVAASALLIFASNTAIIGAYHVFLALSRMGFFPKIIEARNKWRDTPHVAIILATGIPIIVLIAVQGRIDTLGELYAFGLLGAFSLTCIGLDIVRYRERHGGPHVGALEDPELLGLPAHASPIDAAQIANRSSLTVAPSVASASAPAAATAAEPDKRKLSHRIWGSIDFYLGILTTLMVVMAWSTNLVNKPLATLFGGGLTVFGLGVSVINIRYQARRGTPVPLVLGRLARDPNSVLALLTPSRGHNQSVIQSAIRSAHGRPIIFVYVAQPQARTPELLEVNEPYLHDARAQRALSAAAAAAAGAGVTARFAYRVGTPAEVAQRMWSNLRSQEIIAEVSTAKQLSEGVRPEYVRYQLVDGVRVAHYRRHSPTTQRDGQSAESGVWTSAATAPATPMPTSEAAPSQEASSERPSAPTDTTGASPTLAASDTAETPAAEATARRARAPRYPRRVDPNLRLPGQRGAKASGARPTTVASQPAVATDAKASDDASDTHGAPDRDRTQWLPVEVGASVDEPIQSDAAPAASNGANGANGSTSGLTNGSNGVGRLSGNGGSSSRPVIRSRSTTSPTSPKITRGNGPTRHRKTRSGA